MTNNENKEIFKSRLKMAISNSCKELTSKEHKISYNEGKNITNQVRNVFIGYIGFTPKEIDGACDMALIFIAPSMKEKKLLIKKIVAGVGSTAALAAIITGVGLALGWGTGIVAAVIAYFTGISLLGPVAWISAGAIIAVLAGYFYFSSTDESEAEQFEKALTGGVEKAIDEIWNQYGERIGEKIQKENRIS